LNCLSDLYNTMSEYERAIDTIRKGCYRAERLRSSGTYVKWYRASVRGFADRTSPRQENGPSNVIGAAYSSLCDLQWHKAAYSKAANGVVVLRSQDQLLVLW